MSRCPYCSDSFGTPPIWWAEQRIVPCERCARIAGLVFLEEQGDGTNAFREVMIRQNEGEPRRKLLETVEFHFVIFFDDEDRISNFMLSDRDEAHLLNWKRGESARFYGVRNEGRSYVNHDRVFINGAFHAAPVLAELEKCGQSIRPEVRQVLLEGIQAYVAWSATAERG